MDEIYQAEVVTQSGPLRLRNAPVDGLIVGYLGKGDVVDVLEELFGWSRVRCDGKVGYASAQYLRRIDGTKENNDPQEGFQLVLTDSAGNIWRPVGGFTVTLEESVD